MNLDGGKIGYGLRQLIISAMPKVSLIGAGIAGLAAAIELEKQGVDFILLEAQDRVGGRIYVKELPNGKRIHLGANWIHNATADNPLLRFATE